MAQRSSISKQKFDELLEEQKGQKILKWAELEEGEIYEIVKFEQMDTKVGKSGIITLSDDNRVWTPSALTKRLENLDLTNSTAYVRPKGKTKSKKTCHMYNDFDFVLVDRDD